MLFDIVITAYGEAKIVPSAIFSKKITTFVVIVKLKREIYEN